MNSDSMALVVNDLEVEYRTKGRARVRAVAGVSLQVGRGEIVGLVGESGCGKSTVAKAVVGIERPAAGEVLYRGARVTPISRIGKRPKNQRNLQMVFQEPASSLNPRRSIGSQVADALKFATDLPQAKHEERVRELLDMVGLPKNAHRAYPHQFSGGQKQRACIARALAADPEVLVADEAISSLDASAQAQIADLLVGLVKKLDIGLLFISHDLAVIGEICDRIAVMYLGKIVELGRPEQIWFEPRHPYARALMRSVPRIGRDSFPESLEGEVPDPANPPSGCRFNTRCPFVMDKCRVQEPALIDVEQEDGGTVACWLQEPGAVVDLDTLATEREVASA
ncbi:ABC transporter ATP-binding protein [Ruania rhizosphaerae]|uniref:ABC transporter ATP-binding protein n=1 Tax=Ruania rhizosphaerae TaxID=1840413 RepID=UPI001357B785|nr:ABC transporter ATP-binding protein [Ruania rhizosphaerae]